MIISAGKIFLFMLWFFLKFITHITNKFRNGLSTIYFHISKLETG